MKKWSLFSALVFAGLVGGWCGSAAAQGVNGTIQSAPLSAGLPPAQPGAPASSSAPFAMATPLSSSAPVDGAIPLSPANPLPCCTSTDEKVPFKWSWGGQYRILPNASNFGFHSETISDDQPTQSFVNQRMRVWATVNPNEHVEGYIQVQFGGLSWGQNEDFAKTFNAAFPVPPPAQDVVGIMLRRAWVAYQDEDCGKWRAGILDWHDSFGDTLASSDYDFDIGGFDWTKTFKDLGNMKVIFGAFFLSDLPLVSTLNSDVEPGSHSAWLFTFDVDQPIGEKSSVGASFYYLPDRGQYSYATYAPYRSAYDVWLGVRAKTVLMDNLPLNGFAILNNGAREDIYGETVFEHTGWAGKFEVGPVPLGPGNLSGQVLYSSGSTHPGIGSTSEFRTVAQSYQDNFGAEGYWSYMHITSANGPSDVNDLGVSLQDRGLGLITFQTKYEYPICKKLSGTSAVGWLRSACSNPVSGSAVIGTELSQMFTYKFGGGLALDVGGAWLFTGDFYKTAPDAPSPDDLWMLFARLQLEF